MARKILKESTNNGHMATTEHFGTFSLRFPFETSYLHVSSMTYPDICSCGASLTLIRSVTSLTENTSLKITTNGNVWITLKPSTFWIECNMEEQGLPRSTRATEPIFGVDVKEFEAHLRRNLQ